MLKKIIRFLLHRLQDYRTRRKFERVAKETKIHRERKSSDIKRWIKKSEFLPDWNERSKIIASMIPAGARIIEFGAGTMNITSYLPEKCTYKATDIVARTPEMLECDLNKRIDIDLNPFDTAIFSGVLEYVYDIKILFYQFQEKIPNIFLSYACSDICTMNRLNKGWLSDYTFSELHEIFSETGYEIVERKNWRSQIILKLKKV